MFVDEYHVTSLNQGLFSTTMEAEKRDPGNEVGRDVDHRGKWRVYYKIIRANKGISPEAAEKTSLPTRFHRTRLILVLFTRPIHRSRERTEYIPALNISGTSTLPDTAELETDRTSIRSPNLPGGCCSTIISTPTGSRTAAPAPLVMNLFCFVAP